MQYDVAIIGAGPAGLCLATMLAQLGLQVVLIEQQEQAALAAPAFDGREIALTHHSQQLLQQAGIWAELPAAVISPLRDAKVFNGPDLYAMRIHGDGDGLGVLVANQALRLAAFRAAMAQATLQLLFGRTVATIAPAPQQVQLTLDDGSALQCRLLVAADSRFSETRRRMGIASQMHDFGRSMLVCVMTHPQSHQQTAWEWFDHGRTLALLPMNDGRSSVVITMPAQQIAALQALPDHAFNREVTAMFQSRLGHMQVVSSRHAYPLVTVAPERLVGPRFALAGDAAIGMHPVTAHGFNFGLMGAAALTKAIREAMQQDQDIASAAVLQAYALAHKRATRPLFVATHLLVKLYSRDHGPQRLLRNALLRAGNWRPVRRLLAQALR